MWRDTIVPDVGVRALTMEAVPGSPRRPQRGLVATAYLFGVSARRVEKLAESLGVTRLSKSQVSAVARHLDEQVAAFRNRSLDAGPAHSSGWMP
jgi:Transposase, Mutator family